MSEYQSIARKFRPTRFAEVVGQTGVVQTLKNAILLKKSSHAYLFTGLRGTGKTSLARIFAKSLNCSSPIDQVEPCNLCSSCKEITKGHSLDVVEIDGASNRGIDDIRKLNENIAIATFQGKYRIYIIDEVHMLTKEAFNALLKTLEEPPPNVKFFLATTEPQKVLSTILSRCQRFDLKRIDDNLIIEKLCQISKELAIDVEEDVFILITSLAEGSLRDAETLLDRILVTENPPITVESARKIFALLPTTLFAKLDATFSSGEISQIFVIAQEIFSSGFNTNYFLDALIKHYRDILYAYYSPIDSIYLIKEEKKVVEKALTIYPIDALHFILDFIISLHSKKQNLELTKIEIEMILLHIVQTKHRVSLNQIIEKLKDGPKPVDRKITTPSSDQKTDLESIKIEEKLVPVEITNPKIPEPPAQPQQSSNENFTITKNALPPPEPISTEKVFAPPIESSPSIANDIRTETLLRFASVELTGTLKKHLN